MEMISLERRGGQRDPVGVALVGVSGIAARYVGILKRMPGLSLRWVVSRDPLRAGTFAREHGIPSWSEDLGRALGDDAVDVVLVLTEPMRHVEIASLALRAGKDCLIEKPLDVDPARAEGLLAESLGSGRVMGVVAPYRFDPVLIDMKRTLDAGGGGGARLASLFCMWPRDRDYYEGGSGWRGERGPFFLNQGVHWLDLLNWFFGVPQRVSSASRVTRPFLRCSDLAGAVIEYPGDVVATVAGGSFGRGRTGDRFVVVHPGGVLDYQQLRGPEPPQGWRERLARRLAGGPVWGRPAIDTMEAVCRDFIDAVRARRAPASGLADGVAAMRLAIEIGGAGG